MTTIGVAVTSVDDGGRRRRRRSFDAAAGVRVETTTTTKEEREMREEDPIEVLGEDLMMEILGKLKAQSLARSVLVSRHWFALASSDSLWSPLCEQLWMGKAHIPRWAEVPGLSKLARYSRAILDSKRVRIMREDLCDHAWEFHFTENELEPPFWWCGGGDGIWRVMATVILFLFRLHLFSPWLPQHIGKISTHTGEAQALLCVAISTLVEAILQISKTRFGVVMSVLIPLLQALLAMVISENTV